jgi:hypothetical protein
MKPIYRQRRGSSAYKPAGTTTDWSVGRVNVQTAYGGNLAAAFASGDTMLYVPPGTYNHSTVLGIRSKDVVFERVTLNGTNGLQASCMVSGVSPKIRFVGDCFIVRPQWTVRQNPVETQGVTIGSYGWATSNVTFIADNLSISRAWGAGFFVHGTAGAVISGKITNTGSAADSFHTTGGSTDIDFQASLTATDSGDDGAAVVSYGGEAQCERIRYRHVTVNGNQVWGRGITVVGGKDVIFDYANIQNSAGAGIYIACEGVYNTWGVDNVTVVAARVRTPNRKNIHPSNVLVFSDVAGKIVTNVNVLCDPDPNYPLYIKTGAQPATNIVVTAGTVN